MQFFMELNKWIQKFIWKTEQRKNSSKLLEKNYNEDVENLS